jgi:hypothetical protein
MRDEPDGPTSRRDALEDPSRHAPSRASRRRRDRRLQEQHEWIFEGVDEQQNVAKFSADNRPRSIVS